MLEIRLEIPQGGKRSVLTGFVQAKRYPFR
jgi:hypothetical protein